MARQYYKDSTTGQMKPLGVKVEDTLPVGTEVDYDGQDIPEGWEEVDDTVLLAELDNNTTNTTQQFNNIDFSSYKYVQLEMFYVQGTNNKCISSKMMPVSQIVDGISIQDRYIYWTSNLIFLVDCTFISSNSISLTIEYLNGTSTAGFFNLRLYGIK